MRLRILSSVDLPAPLRPMMPTTSPCLTSKETSFKAQNSSVGEVGFWVLGIGDWALSVAALPLPLPLPLPAEDPRPGTQDLIPPNTEDPRPFTPRAMTSRRAT